MDLNLFNLPTHLPNDTETPDVPPPTIEIKEQKPSVTPAKKNPLPVPITGTSIVLETEEDIAKWIAERKKKWPSRKRMLEKEEEAKEKHEEKLQEMKKLRSDKPNICRFFQKGNCKNGDKCKMSHIQVVKPFPNHQVKNFKGIAVQVPERYKPSVQISNLNNLIIENEMTKDNEKVIGFIEKLFNENVLSKEWEG